MTPTSVCSMLLSFRDGCGIVSARYKYGLPPHSVKVGTFRTQNGRSTVCPSLPCRRALATDYPLPHRYIPVSDIPPPASSHSVPNQVHAAPPNKRRALLCHEEISFPANITPKPPAFLLHGTGCRATLEMLSYDSNIQYAGSLF